MPKKVLALIVVLTMVLSAGSAVALSSTVFKHTNPRATSGVVFDSAGYIVGPKCSDNPLRMRSVKGCSRVHYDQ